jgi:hypothetical protein
MFRVSNNQEFVLEMPGMFLSFGERQITISSGDSEEDEQPEPIVKKCEICTG